MPDQQQGMKQTHGGDDTGGAAAPAPVKKISLGKYAPPPDVNIRDVFWRIMAEYAAKKGQGMDVTRYENMRTALIRIALSVLENPESAYHGLSPQFTALYTLTMILDGNWEDMFRQVLQGTSRQPPKIRRPLVRALQKLMLQDRYREQITRYMEQQVKSIMEVGPALLYVLELDDRLLVQALRKWILVIAQTDIETNQVYAISALAKLEGDAEVRQLFLRLLTHWDPQTRKVVAALLARAVDEEAIRHAERQLPLETDAEVQKLLQRIAGKKANAGKKEGERPGTGR